MCLLIIIQQVNVVLFVLSVWLLPISCLIVHFHLLIKQQLLSYCNRIQLYKWFIIISIHSVCDDAFQHRVGLSTVGWDTTDHYWTRAAAPEAVTIAHCYTPGGMLSLLASNYRPFKPPLSAPLSITYIDIQLVRSNYGYNVMSYRCSNAGNVLYLKVQCKYAVPWGQVWEQICIIIVICSKWLECSTTEYFYMICKVLSDHSRPITSTFTPDMWKLHCPSVWKVKL